MPRVKRRIGTTGAGHYVASEQNPNDPCGGQCLCGTKPHDQSGPFLVFHGHVVQDGVRVRPVVCTPCVKSAVVDIEAGGEVARVGAGGPEDHVFDGGEPDQPEDYQALKARYEREAAGQPLLHVPTFDQWLEAQGGAERAPNLKANTTTGIDPNAKSLLEARAAASPVGLRGGPAHGRTDDPVAQLADPANWGTPDDAEHA